MLPGGTVSKLYRKTCKKNSFVAGTLVHLKGKTKPIEEIEIGEYVLSYNEESGTDEYSEVIHIIEGEQEYILAKLFLDNGDVIESTGEHPFYSNGKWVDAIDLRAGDFVTSTSNDSFLITKVESSRKTEKVYNITIRGNHNYYVGKAPVLVHNALPWCKILTASGKIDRSISVDPKKLQKKWKHAYFFGVSGNYNKASASSFKKAIEDHVASGNTIPIPGKYRGQEVIHFLDPATGLNVIKSPGGQFISGWKLGPEQLANVTKHGGLN